MYSKHESSQIRQSFWTAFGVYMALNHSAEGEKINWINYKTGVKHLQFKLYADSRMATIAIEIDHHDEAARLKYFQQFLQTKKLLRQFLNEDWNWQSEIEEENEKIISRISKELPMVNIYNKEDWPAFISFFKCRLIALDEFWSLASYGFKNL